jgi:hypothetical protein
MPGSSILFPRLGVVRRFTNRTEGRREGYPTPWAYNVRLEDVLTNRLRGGSFTGQKSATFTADSDTETYTAAAHPFVDGLKVQLTTTDTLPDGLELLTDYYIINSDTDSFQLSESYGGSAVDIIDNGIGTHTASPFFAKPSPVYRDRAITFDDVDLPNAITAARQGDSTDTDLDADVSDVARPILFQLSEAGSTGGTIVAVAPHKDAYLLCWTATETWVLSGDPATGQLRRVSDRVGIIGASAWCMAHDTCYFLSEQGLYRVQADGSGLQAVSEDRVPEDLTGVEDSACILNYYHPDRGVYLHLTTAPSWFYDTAREGFWPFDTSVTDSHLLIGPLRLGSVNTFGLIQTLHGIMATGSASVTWAIVPGETAEEAAANGKAAITAALASESYSTYVKASGTWSAGRSYTSRPRVTAMWCCLWLSSTGTWAYEGITTNVIPAGFWR